MSASVSSPSGPLVCCPGCGSLLSPPPGITTFQCSKCHTIMEQPAAPSLSSSPLASLSASISASPFPSTSNSPLSSAPTSSTNSPASHNTTLSSLPSSSLPSQSPTPLSSVSASAFSTPLQTHSALTTLTSASALSSGTASPTPSSTSSSSSSKKKRKDPQAPKRSSNAYMVFCQEQRNQLKEAEPSLAFGKLGKRLGEIWRNMTPEEKQPYEDRAGRDRGRYKQEMTKYQSEQMRQQVESHRMASLQHQQQRQQQQLIAAAQQHDLETRKRARIDVPLTWPGTTQQQPMVMMAPMGQIGQMGQMGQMGQFSQQMGQMGQLAQMGQMGQMSSVGSMGQMTGGMQPGMLSAGLNPLLNTQQMFSSSTFDPRLAGLYQTSSTSYPTNMSATMSLPSFVPSTGPLGTATYPAGSMGLSTSSPITFSTAGSPLTAMMSPLTSFPTSSPTPHR